MRVLVNGLSMLGARTGVGHYAAEMVRAVRVRLGEDVRCFQPEWAASLKRWWAWFRSGVEKPSTMRPATVGSPPGRTWRGRILDGLRQAGLSVYAQRFRAVSRQGFDLYHEPNFIPLACDLPTVLTVHDLSVLLYPHWHPSDRVAHFASSFPAGLARACRVLTVTEHVRQEIIRHLGVPADRVGVTCNGVRAGFTPLPAETVRERLKTLGLPTRYLLHVGTIEPRKNLLMLMKAYCTLPASVRASCPLVLAGGWGWNSSDVHEYLHREGRHKGVLQVGYVPEGDLGALYNGARALVFPTHYEGFGMPAAEMLACGGAVLASTAGAVAEVLGGKGHLTEPQDESGWREAMQRVIEDDEWRESLCVGGVERAATYTWDRCAEETLAGYAKALRPVMRRAA